MQSPASRRTLQILLLSICCCLAVPVAGAAAGAQASETATPVAQPADWPIVDYGNPTNWLALPDHPSAAMHTPKGAGFSNLQDVAQADVFYIHPTTSMGGNGFNAAIDDAEAARIGALMLLTQATPFNAVARVYAPRYRQVTLPLYEQDEETQQRPTNLAYADVLAAFRHYVTHYNAGRPFILVGHSQGTNHAQRLLSEAIQGTPMEHLLVAAYLPGQPIPRSVFRDDLRRIGPCVRPAQTRCVAIWGTFGENTDADLAAWRQNGYWNSARQRWITAPAQALSNINPVSWDARRPRTTLAQHRGAVPFGTNHTFDRLLPRLVAVRNDGSFDFVSPAPLPAQYFNDGGVFGGTNYHVFDIALFWLDLRENARLRLNAWMNQQHRRQPLLDVTATAQAQVGKPWRYRIAVQHAVTAFALDGLPAGLRLDTRRGVISGTPEQAGTFALRITASNRYGSDHGELALTVER